MSTQEQEREEQTVFGEVVSVITKGADTWQIAVMPEGSQYTKNLWTKDEGLRSEMERMIGQQATFYCNVSHWTRQDGQPVRSLWINGWSGNGGAPSGEMASLGDEVAQAQAALDRARAAQAQREREAQQTQEQMQTYQTGGPQQQDGYVPQAEKEVRIMREAADKCAAWVLASMLASGGIPPDEMTTEKLHGFMDAFAKRRINFYLTGESQYADDIPF